MSEILSSIRRKTRRRRSRRLPENWRFFAMAALGLASVVVLYGGFRALAHSQPFTIKTIRISGLERLYEDDVRLIAARAIGAPTLVCDLDSLRAALETLPGVRRAVVSRRLPDLIDIRITERVAVARATVARRQLLVDEAGALFPCARELPGDALLPRIKGLRTPGDQRQLDKSDVAALRALEALENVTGRRPPDGTIVDVTPEDRIFLRPGPDAPALWLDREAPERNLRNLFVWKDSVARFALEGAIDLRFPNRLTVVPADGRSRME